MYTSTNFTLRGGDAAFANRQKMLFDQLSIAESKCNKHDESEKDHSSTGMHMDMDNDNQAISRIGLKRGRRTKKFRGKESIFKRPEGPAPRASFIRAIPDYHKNPHKWIKYSLDDVPNEDMTEQSNTEAAMSFLKELKARKKKGESQEKMDVEPCESDVQDCTKMFQSKKHTSKIVFRKPQKELENSEAVIINVDEKPTFRNSKIILPEYVIGQKPKKICKQKKPMIKVDHLKELKLEHLEEPDEEDN